MEKAIIGREVKVDIDGIASGIPAKVDTGADGSAIWASRIRIDEEGYLHFYLFDKSSPFYTGEEIVTKDYSVTEVTSASGHVLIKFCPYFKIKIAGTIALKPSGMQPIRSVNLTTPRLNTIK